MPNMTHGKWRFWLDRGGTFIDIVAVSPQGHMTIKKTLSENTDGGLQAVREILSLPPKARIPASQVAKFASAQPSPPTPYWNGKGKKWHWRSPAVLPMR